MRKLLIVFTSVILIAVLFLILLSVGIIPYEIQTFSQSGPQQTLPFTMERTEEEQYALNLSESLTISNPVGKIVVSGAQVREIELAVTKKARAGTLARTQELLDNITVTIEDEPELTELRVHLPSTSDKEQASADLALTVPFEIFLQLFAGLGDVQIKHIQGELQIQNDLGRIEIDNFVGNASLESRLGDIKVTNSFFWENLKATAHLGRMYLQGSLAEKTVLENKLGDLEIMFPEHESYLLDGQILLGGFSSQAPFQGQKGKQSIQGIIGLGEQKGALFVKVDLGSLTFKSSQKEED